MLTTAQIERQLHCCNQVPRNETPVQRIERLKQEVAHAVMHDYPGGVTILHLVDEFNLSESVVRKIINGLMHNGKLERELISKQQRGTTVTYATYRPTFRG